MCNIIKYHYEYPKYIFCSCGAVYNRKGRPIQQIYKHHMTRMRLFNINGRQKVVYLENLNIL